MPNLFLKLTNFVLFLLITGVCAAQDSIVFLNKNVVIAVVREVGVSSVKYKKFENPEGPDYVTNKTEINYIRYKSGNVDKIDSLLNHSAKPIATEAIKDTKERGLDMYSRGCRDAKIYYTHGGGSTCIGFTGCAIGILGVIPAAIVAYTPPSEKNLTYPNKVEWSNADYRRGYTYTAHKIKRKKVWTGYGIGLATAIVAVFVVNSMNP
jgi:hypothetical protein